MIEQTNAEAIGQYGYTHYTGMPVSTKHEIALIPQSVADGWEGFCSCGEWRGFASFYEFSKKPELIGALKVAHAAHAQEIGRRVSIEPSDTPAGVNGLP